MTDRDRAERVVQTFQKYLCVDQQRVLRRRILAIIKSVRRDERKKQSCPVPSYGHMSGI